MKNYQLFIGAFALLLLSSCAQVYHTTDSSTIATKHQNIAILTPEVLISPQQFVRPEVLEALQDGEALKLQYEMYDWIVRRTMSGRFMEVNIQEVSLTNEKLEEAGYFDGKKFSKKELCNILGVDAILGSNYTLNTPFSTAYTIATGVLLDEWEPVRETTVTLSLYDKENEKQIWHYRNSMVDTSNSPTTFVNSFMRHASRKMPYRL